MTSKNDKAPGTCTCQSSRQAASASRKRVMRSLPSGPRTALDGRLYAGSMRRIVRKER